MLEFCRGRDDNQAIATICHTIALGESVFGPRGCMGSATMRTFSAAQCRCVDENIAVLDLFLTASNLAVLEQAFALTFRCRDPLSGISG
jgi:hypothetical protein